MSIRVKPSELKLAAKVANQVRDVSGGGANKKYAWLNFYRLIADPGFGLALYATDGSSWLTWMIPTEELVEDTYDVVLSSSKLSDFLSKAMDDGESYEIIKEEGQIAFVRGITKWRMNEEEAIPYPKAPAGGQAFEEFSVSAATLVKNFKFAEPFIHSTSATASNTVATWTRDGLLITGAARHLIRIEGMPCPPVNVNFKQRPLNSVVSFLNAIQEDVNITLSGKNYTFRCPASGSEFVVLGETAQFQSALELGDQEPTVIKFDGKTLLKGVSIMNTLLPAEADRILVKITGSHENAFIHITTLTTESKRSSDGFPIIRETGGDEDIQFVVNCRIFEVSLDQMEGAILEGRFYGAANPPRLLIEDERTTDDDTYRCVLIPVTMSVIEADKEDEEEPEKPKKLGTKKPEKKPLLSKS